MTHSRIAQLLTIGVFLAYPLKPQRLNAPLIYNIAVSLGLKVHRAMSLFVIQRCKPIAANTGLATGLDWRCGRPH